MRHRIALFSWLVLLSAAAAHAQITGEPDPSKVRVRLGPLWLNPTFSLKDVGVDTNVFNEADSDAPKSDFTITISPQTDLWLRMGRTWLTGVVREDLVWYNRYGSERSANNRYSLAWIVPLTRVAFSVGSSWSHTRERPGFEIDARSERHEVGINGAFEIRALARTLFGARGDRQVVKFDEQAVFLGTKLDDELNRTVTTASFTVRQELTLLTSLTLDAGRSRERFDLSPLRDSDSTQINFGIRFDPFALVSGSAQVGFRDYVPASPDVPGYRGSTATVNLSYVLGGSTRLGVQIGRDVQQSYDINQPYYLQTGISGSIAQQIYGPLDVEGRLGAQRLGYRDRAGAVVAAADRVDRVRTRGAGVGYRIGTDVRLGFNLDHQQRESRLERRRYSGLRYGMSVTYGI